MFTAMMALVLAAAPAPIWRQSSGDATVDLCVRPSYCENGVCYSEVIIGGYSHQHRLYRTWNGEWGPIGEPPIPVKARAKNFGIETGRPKEAYSLNGKAASREEAMAAVLHDDSKLPHLTIVDKNHAEIVKQLASLKDTVRLQGYPPDHWAVKNIAPLGGVVYQSPDGKVLAKLDKYTDLPTLMSALRVEPAAPVSFGVVVAIVLGFFLWRRYAAAQ